MTCDMSPIVQTIGVSAQQGYLPAALFFPVEQHGKRRGMPLDFEQSGMMSCIGKAQLLLQRPVGGGGAGTAEIILQSSTITMQAGFGSVAADGFGALYGALAEKGAQGYTLNAVIDEPNQRMTGFLSAATTVHLVMSRRPGAQGAEPKQYTIVSVPVNIQVSGLTSVTATMPELMPTLAKFLSEGHRVAAIYNPPVIAQRGLFSGTTQCHIIFEKTATIYTSAVADSAFTVSQSCCSMDVAHQYLPSCGAFLKAGWELAGIIDMPDRRLTGMASGASTVKMIFQAPTTASASGPTSAPAEQVMEAEKVLL